MLAPLRCYWHGVNEAALSREWLLHACNQLPTHLRPIQGPAAQHCPVAGLPCVSTMMQPAPPQHHARPFLFLSAYSRGYISRFGPSEALPQSKGWLRQYGIDDASLSAGWGLATIPMLQVLCADPSVSPAGMRMHSPARTRTHACVLMPARRRVSASRWRVTRGTSPWARARWRRSVRPTEASPRP